MLTPIAKSSPQVPLPYHPCMNEEAHDKVARIHLPVAPLCNIQCAYCQRVLDAPKGCATGPGSTAGVLSVDEAVSEARNFLAQWGPDSIVGIAGPGDPLANPETFQTLAGIKAGNPSCKICLCTNGLMLPDEVQRLADIGLETVSVTVNGIDREVMAELHPRILLDGRTYGGTEGAGIFTDRQWAGIESAIALGMSVKVNMVVVPEVNGAQAEPIARRAAQAGVTIFNPVPLIPRGGLCSAAKPGIKYMQKLREECSAHLPVFTKCKQCRADARGIPGMEVSLAK
ncbi:radical SAM protein [Desulfovibrio sp. JC010]|uniref:radical SAM protein n=1 Tax=Desulfovibrio sp. JC010 TaxID=2593641 RepID=UPI0013D76264|nr:radical SAM protein [Desulfovibrio sp. JC010]NDV28323.1 radical SAM protein [Desulfovibrio sp. JC010]